MSLSMSSLKRVLTTAAFGFVLCGPTHFAFAGDDPPKAARDELKSRQARIDEQVTAVKAILNKKYGCAAAVEVRATSKCQTEQHIQKLSDLDDIKEAINTYAADPVSAADKEEICHIKVFAKECGAEADAKLNGTTLTVYSTAALSGPGSDPIKKIISAAK